MQKVLTYLFFSDTLETLWYHRKLPFLKYIRTTLILPDGNKLGCIWFPRIRFVVDDIYKLRVYDQFFEMEKGYTVLDVGAHIGIYSLRVAKKVGPNGLVIAIEPETDNYKMLSKNVTINHYQNIVPLKLALSDFEGESTLYTCGHGSGLHSLLKGDKGGSTIDVSVTTVDNLVKSYSLKKVDVMKIDVEGVELEVLKGAEKSLESLTISRICIGVYHNPRESAKIQDFLKRFNYTLHIVDFKGRRGKYLYALKR